MSAAQASDSSSAPRVVAVWRLNTGPTATSSRLIEFSGPALAPLIIPAGPDPDGGKRRMADEARALGMAVEWSGEASS